LQYVDRGPFPPPAPFQDDAARSERLEFLGILRNSSERIAQTTAPTRQFSLASDEILTVLHALFRGKCAFCETRTSLQAHLFRPSEEAEPLARSEFAHLYYAWLRTDWGNVYGSCINCSMSAKRHFPVVGLERGNLPTVDEMQRFVNENYGLWRGLQRDKKLLLDPCEVRSFVRHLSFSRDGQIRAFTNAAAQTISTFSLDRKDLTEARATVFDGNIKMLRRELERGIAPNMFDFNKLEFGGAWYLLLRRVIEQASQILGQTFKSQPQFALASIKQLWDFKLGRDALEVAFEEAHTPVKRQTVARPVVKGQVRQLSSVCIKNFKSIEHLEVDVPQAILRNEDIVDTGEAAALLILGENAVGKSSILEAVALALSEETTRKALGLSPKNFILDPSLMGAPERPGPAHAEVILHFDDGKEMQLAIADAFEEKGVRDRLPPIFAYGAFRQYALRPPMRSPHRHVATLFRSDAVLSNPEAWLLALPSDEFAMVIRALKRIFIVEGDFDVVRRDLHNKRCLIVGKVMDGESEREITTPFKVVSSGFRSILAMVCDVLAGLLNLQKHSERKSFSEIDAVILIDEVEAHLHPRWKMQIMTAIRRVLPKATILATTHDPLTLRGMYDQEVVVLNRAIRYDDEALEKLPMFVEPVIQLPNVENLTIEQLLTSDFFSMFSTDSPATELRFAKFGDLIARKAKGEILTDYERLALEELNRQVVEAIPLGSSEVQRLIQEAIYEFLQKRHGASARRLAALKEETRKSIITALGEY
jgi:ABC-type cobalamin/Fe3+-siderophores transport system ATPase subunit